MWINDLKILPKNINNRVFFNGEVMCDCGFLLQVLFPNYPRQTQDFYS